MKYTTSLPFGLLFEEESVDSPNSIIHPLYDEDQDVSVWIDKEGNRIPFVEHLGVLSTKTATKTSSEGSDDDETLQFATSTRTITEENNEESDSDEDLNYSINLRTTTMTFDQSEQSDEDEDRLPQSTFFLNTKTDTRELNENSDEDE